MPNFPDGFIPGDELPANDPCPLDPPYSEADVLRGELNWREAESQFLTYVAAMTPPFTDEQIQEAARRIEAVRIHKKLAGFAIEARLKRAMQVELE